MRSDARTWLYQQPLDIYRSIIYLEGNVVHFHRSWTGDCIYQVTFERQREQYIVTDALVDRFFNRRPDNYAVELLHFLIYNLLLGKSSAFPKPAGLREGDHPGIFQHHTAGTGYPEREVASADE